ncbi:PQQ-binding-like beta-propeller repeat protein [Saccharothrix violaceirubra]|uniref:Polyvinyl alcohol dehydrogenase (Cytochrome) n=1 Tax=Saccharothrix violaceirubra TaxID=413306 RepID=A0A7W7T3J9_9PSEU|nr:PQQ-binding-like beta-propeller repeat protein [Saccharothrix violaceirubra]MBB4965903.1 polyvinyl alcohol dehydrogenase (cytochrome) [Saccharothrix violaceirubra]
MTIRRRVAAAAVCAVSVAALTTTAQAAGTADAARHDGDWGTWSKDLSGSRHNAAEWRITPDNVHRLKLKWVYAHPKSAAPVRSQPAIVDGTAYFGSDDGTFQAVDARTGAQRWSADLRAGLPPGERPPLVWDSPSVSKGRVYFGDLGGRLHALDQRTGERVWTTKVDTHPSATLTSSPIVYDGKVYVGTSSGENANNNGTGDDPAYPCCTFRGHIDAFDAATGALAWRHYTVPQPQAVGTWPSGATRYEPSGAGVWSSPVVDQATGTVYVGTGQNYTGSAGDFDTLLALDHRTGAVKWRNQVTKADTWRAICNTPDAEGYCPGLKDGTALDYDIGATPNLFTVGGRRLVGVGQKLGVYHVFDAATGEVVWRRQLGVPLPGGGISGIQWGSSFDGRRLYIATYFADPGKVFAVDPGTGRVLWETPNPADGCTTGGAAGHPDLCSLAHGAAVTTSPGLVFEGSNDGKFRAYSARDGRVLWTFDTLRDFAGVDGRTGRGGAIAGGGGGAVVANGMVYAQSGYSPEYPSPHGTVLLAFGL